MNKQQKMKKGVVVGRGIEWTDFTFNPISGCFHACAWQMPDGTVANCYAEDVADRVAQAAYPLGFEHHYFKPSILVEPSRQKVPSRIFVGSMADVFGHWVPEAQIDQVLDACRAADWHTFQFLTKNPRRVLQFVDRIPKNCWIGASTPPDHMWNKPLKSGQRMSMLMTTLKTLHAVRQRGIVTWMSAEPLTIDVGAYLKLTEVLLHSTPIDWMVIGAASNGRNLYAPDQMLVEKAVNAADQFGIKIFYKGNMKTCDYARENWREEFPAKAEAAQ